MTLENAAVEPESQPDEEISEAALRSKQKGLLMSRLFAARFGDIVTVLMQSERHAALPLRDLHTRVVPPLLKGQYRLAEVGRKDAGEVAPAGVVLWARVSDDVHERLCANPEAQIVLTAEEWTSGDNYWIVDVAGQDRFLTQLLTTVRKTDLADKIVHFRQQTAGGPRIGRIPPEPEAA